MTAVVILLIAAGAVLLGIAAGYWLPPNGRLPSRDRPRAVRRILLPFTGQAISRRSFEAAVRLAKAENAIIMPAFLARVPMNLPLESPLPVQCARGMPLLEAIEQRIASQGLPVESRISRGRSARDALHKLLEREDFDRIIVSADEDPHSGLSYDDLRWLLERAPAEILILRPAPEDTRRISAEAGAGAVGRAPTRS
jgi:nucleotide-binding universal stress UspA family protein